MSTVGDVGRIRLDVPLRPERPSTGGAGAFQATLESFLEEVNARQLRAEEMVRAFARGEVEDLHRVILAQQEAAVALRLMVQMRDRVVAAYQEIMRMPI